VTIVALLGDSITHEAEPELRAALAFTTIGTVIGRPGMTATEAGPDAELIAADFIAAELPEIVVVNLGTNDALKNVATAETLAALDGIYATLRPTRIVAVAVTTRFSGSEFDNRVQAINDHLRARCQAGGNPVSVVAWDEIVAADEALLSDGLHPTPRGRARLAAAVAATVADIVGTVSQ